MTATPPGVPPEERPPLGSWPGLYALVVGWLIVQIVLFGWITVSFR